MKMKSWNYKKYILVLSGVIMAFIILWFAICAEPLNVAFFGDDVYTMDGEFTVTSGDKTYTVTAPSDVEADVKDTLIISKILEADDIKGNFIMFYVRQSFVNVYVGNEQCISDISDRDMPYYMTPGAYWHCCRLPDDWIGKELRIEIKADSARYVGEVPVIYTGNKSAFVYMTLENATFSVLVCVPIFVLGLILLGFGVCSSNKVLKERLILLGLFALATSVWNILEARITQVFMKDIQLANIVLFSCYFVIPFLTTCFLDTYETFHKNKVMRALMYGSGCIYILIQVLQGAGVVRYVDLVSLGHVMIAMILGCVAINYIIQKTKTKEVQDGVVYRAIIILGVFCFIDMFIYHLNPLLRATRFSKIGFLLFFFYLGASVMIQMNDVAVKERENNIYKRLAFVDTMTQVYNRTAFEQKIHIMRQQTTDEQVFFYIVDMNNLKHINDMHGHAAGDYAITEIARTLAECFVEGECYRIGGDEFCIITEGVSEDVIKEYGDKVSERLQEKSKELDFEIIIATGYSSLGKDGLDSCFNRADANMYANKAALKQKK